MTNFERGVVLDQWTQWLAPGNGRHKPNVRCRCVILGFGQCWRPWWRRDRVGRSSSSSSGRRRRRVARSEPRQKRNEACAAAVELPAGGHPGHQPELRVQPKALQVIEYATHTHTRRRAHQLQFCACGHLLHCNSPQSGILINASIHSMRRSCPTYSPTHPPDTLSFIACSRQDVGWERRDDRRKRFCQHPPAYQHQCRGPNIQSRGLHSQLVGECGVPRSLVQPQHRHRTLAAALLPACSANATLSD